MRQESRTIVCASGHTFQASVFRSANVSRAPELIDAIRNNSFNRVRCPECGLSTYANVSFLYHDMDSELRVWVYPENSRDSADAILSKIKRAAVIANTVLPTDRRGPELIFGLDELRELIDRF